MIFVNLTEAAKGLENWLMKSFISISLSCPENAVIISIFI
jgi:hypothetical protein